MALSLPGTFWKLSQQSPKQTLWTRHIHRLYRQASFTDSVCTDTQSHGFLALRPPSQQCYQLQGLERWGLCASHEPAHERFHSEGDFINSSYSIKTQLALMVWVWCNKTACLLDACSEREQLSPFQEGKREKHQEGRHTCPLGEDVPSPFPALSLQDCSIWCFHSALCCRLMT